MTTPKEEKTKIRVFKFKPFARVAKKTEDLSDKILLEAAEEIEQGQFEADLGGGVIKKRIAKSGKGKSGGYRAIVFFKKGDKAFFAHVFGKNELGNISSNELKAFKKLADTVLTMSEADLKKQIQSKYLTEVKYDEKENEKGN